MSLIVAETEKQIKVQEAAEINNLGDDPSAHFEMMMQFLEI